MNRSYLSNVFRTTYEMLSDRGYEITSHPSKKDVCDNTSFLPQPFTPMPKKYMEWMEQTNLVGVKDGHEIIVKFWLGHCGVEQIEKIMDTISNRDSSVILVAKKEHITTYARNAILQHSENGCDVELFDMNCLVYNITHHFLQPKMEKITDPIELENVHRAFVKEKTITSYINLLETDPMVRYYNGKHGDMFRITLSEGRVHYTMIAKP